MQDLPPDLPTAALFEAIEKVDGRPWFKCRAIGCAMNHSAKQVAEDRMITHSLCLSGYGVVKCTGTQFFLFDGEEEVRCGRLAITKLLKPRWEARQQNQKRKAEASAQESAMRSGARQRSAQIDDLANSMTGISPSAAGNRKLLAGNSLTSIEVNESIAKCFIVNGLPHALVGCPYFRKMLEAYRSAPQVRIFDRHNLTTSYCPRLFEETTNRVMEAISVELVTYGGCQMSDGAKGTAGTSFCNFLIGLPSRVYFLEAFNTGGTKKTDKWNAQMHYDVYKRLSDYSYTTLGGDSKAVLAARNTDLILVDGALSGMESHTTDLMPWATTALCLPHCGDRLFADIVSDERRLADVVDNNGKPITYSGLKAFFEESIKQTQVRPHPLSLIACWAIRVRPFGFGLRLRPSASAFGFGLRPSASGLRALASVCDVDVVSDAYHWRAQFIADFVLNHEAARHMFLAASAQHCPAAVRGGLAPATPKPRKLKKRCETRIGSQFYQGESVEVTCWKGLVGMITDKVWVLDGEPVDFDTWAGTQSTAVFRLAAEFKELIQDAKAHNKRRALYMKIMRPICTDIIRLGDTDRPVMGDVWWAFHNLYPKIAENVKFDPESRDMDDVDIDPENEMMPLLEKIIGYRWQYTHCAYHGVGFLLNPVHSHRDFTELAHKIDGQTKRDWKDANDDLYSELMNDLTAVGTKLFYDEDKATTDTSVSPCQQLPPFSFGFGLRPSASAFGFGLRLRPVASAIGFRW